VSGLGVWTAAGGLASENETKHTRTHTFTRQHTHTRTVTLISPTHPPFHPLSPNPLTPKGRTFALHGNSSNDEDADEGKGTAAEVENGCEDGGLTWGATKEVASWV